MYTWKEPSITIPDFVETEARTPGNPAEGNVIDFTYGNSMLVLCSLAHVGKMHSQQSRQEVAKHVYVHKLYAHYFLNASTWTIH